MKILLALLLGYAIGNINPAVILSKLKGFDIRDKGTGNAGASNVTMIMGKKAGAATAVFDILKATAAVIIAERLLFPGTYDAGLAAGIGCVLGHIFPALMKFRGGKGLASLGGMILGLSPLYFAAMLAAALVLVIVFDYISLIAPVGSVIFTLIYAFSTGDAAGTAALAVLSVIVAFKHTKNFIRIHNDTEKHVSSLWKK